MFERRALLAVLCLAAWAGPAAVRAEQFVLFEATATFPSRNYPGAGPAFYRLRMKPEVPTNWAEPVNFKDGTCHIRYEILEKEEPGRIRYQVCWFGAHGLKHVCSDRPGSETVGVLETEETPCKMWRNHDQWDWTRAVRSGFIRIIHPKEKNYKDPLYKTMKPIEVHVAVTVVSEGATYTPLGTYGGLHYKDLTELKAVAAYLEQGSMGAALVTAEKELGSDDPKRAGEARRVVEALDRYVEARRAELARLKARDPFYAVEALVELAGEFRPSEKARKLLAEARAWSKEEATLKEGRARKIFEAVKKTADNLRRKLRGKKASDPEMQRKYARDIAIVARNTVFLKKKYPDTPSCGRAVALAEGLGVPLGD